LFDKITILGLGLIGASLAKAIKRKQPSVDIFGVDTPDVVARALELGLITQGAPPNRADEAIRAGDLIILALPIQAIVASFEAIAAHARAGTLVTDVGSTKAEIVAHAEKCLPPDVYFLGGHPMTGSERTGLAASDPFLFQNAFYVLTETSRVPAALKQKLVQLLEFIGAKVIFLPLAAHDEVASVVSHLPQLLAVALMKHVAARNQENPVYMQLAAGGFRDMTRVASSPYAMWEHILKTNTGNILRALDAFIRELNEMKQLVSQNSLQPVFDQAARDRLAIPTNTRGFLHPQYDISVIVEDKPGVLAKITAVLAQANLNVKDIEILKVREGDAGTLRMAFASLSDRTKAVQILTDHHFTVTEKD